MDPATHTIAINSLDRFLTIKAEVDYRWINFTPDGTSLYYAMREKGQPQMLYRSDVLGGVPKKV